MRWKRNFSGIRDQRNWGGELTGSSVVVNEWAHEVEESYVLTKASCGHGRRLVKGKKVFVCL